jgi:hypothetical protein
MHENTLDPELGAKNPQMGHRQKVFDGERNRSKPIAQLAAQLIDGP